MHKTLFFSIAAIICCNAFSQSYQNNWVFGDSAGLNFSGPLPVSFETAITSHEASASISDATGNLLFYTNGRNVWNKNSSVVPNGVGLNIGGITIESSITQGVTIIPAPGSETLFYVFYIKANSPDYGVEYSIVDMEQDGGLGDVTLKNINYYSGYIDEKMNAVKHGNGKDWWLFCKIADTSQTQLNLLRMLITEDGVQIPDTISIPSLFNLGGPGAGATGQMKFSKNGGKLAFTRAPYILLFDFDRCTGELSNLQEVNINEGAYGCEFSPDGRYLYIANYGFGGKLMQFCLTCPEPIEDTKEIIFVNTDDTYLLASLQLGPDDNIYVPIAYQYYAAHLHSYFTENISVINDPDVQGLDCNFDTLTISIAPGRSTMTLPNMPNYNLGSLAGSDCDTLQIAIDEELLPQNNIQLYPNPAGNYFILHSTDNFFNYTYITKLEIADISGKVIKSIAPLFSNTVFTGDLSGGLYFINLNYNNKPKETIKLLIEK